MGLLLEILTKHRQLGQTTKLIRNIYIVHFTYSRTLYSGGGGIVAATSRIFRNNLLSRQGGALLLSWETTIANREHCSDTYLAHDRLSKILIRLLSDPTTEVEFVHPVSAGGSVKFLPAV